MKTRGKKGYILMYAVAVMAVVLTLLTVMTSVITLKSMSAKQNKLNFNKRFEIVALGDKFIGKGGVLTTEELVFTDFKATITSNETTFTTTLEVKNNTETKTYLLIELMEENGVKKVVTYRVTI